jgi:hypothetical protein
MKRAIAMALIASTLLAGLANASAPAAKAKAEGGEAASTARSMDAAYLAVPVLREGRMVNYLFVSVRIEVAAGVDLWRTRERAHFLRDALVRASHTADLSDPEDINALNEARAIEVFRAAAVRILGQNAVGAVSIVSSYSARGSGI